MPWRSPGRSSNGSRLRPQTGSTARSSAGARAAAAQLSPAAFLDAATALVSPTGQLGLTAAIGAADLPLQRAPGLDADYLTVVAAVRPALARLEAEQLAAAQPWTAWANRPED